MSILRVWKLGSLEHRILPSRETINRLADILIERKPNETTDIIWGPDLEVLELKGDGEVNLVTGPGIRVTREGNVVKIEVEPAPDGESVK